jgi:hypothetical protein
MIRWQDYEPDLGLTTALEAKKEIAALTAKVATVDKKVSEIDTKVTEMDGKLNSIAPRIENLEKFISNDGPDTDNDGVPDVRDRDNNTPANTPVDFWGQTARAIPVEIPKNKLWKFRLKFHQCILITIVISSMKQPLLPLAKQLCVCWQTVH